MAETLNVLLVEDNRADANLAMELFEDGGRDVRVTHVLDGAEALEYLTDAAATGGEMPDIILLDLNLPRVDGRAVLRALKAHLALQAIPVIVLTSSEAAADIVESYRLGANCYVSKPMGLKPFDEIIRGIEWFWFDIARLPKP